MKIFNVFKRIEKLESDIALLKYNISFLQQSKTETAESDETKTKRNVGIWCRGCEYYDEGLITSPTGRSATMMTCKLNHVCEDRKEPLKCSGECKNE